MEVWKFKIHHGLNIIELPLCYKVLSAGAQNGEAFIWVKVEDSGVQKAKAHIHVLHTGEWTDEPGLEFIDTVLLNSGNYVLHVFHKFQANKSTKR